MASILHMAWKDIRLLLRDRMGLFFVVGFPIVMGLFFGAVMGGLGTSGGGSSMKVAIVDQDNSEMSRFFAESLDANAQLELTEMPLDKAREEVRRGKLTAMVVLPTGFGANAGIFWNDPPQIQLGLDISRGAESAMLKGFVMEAMGQLIGKRFQDPAQFQPTIEEARQQLVGDSGLNPLEKGLLETLFDSLDTLIDSASSLQAQEGNRANSGPGFQFANIEQIDVSRSIDPNSTQAQVKKLRSRWDISFPQAMLWGVLGCVAGFAVSIAQERTRGTMLRLHVAPVSKFEILAGKATACFLATLFVIALMTALGLMLGMQPASFPKLLAAALGTAFCFVGIMMVMSVLGKTEQSVSGAGWAINMVMAMLGGCMIPWLFLPKLFKTISIISPVKWAIQSIEGAIWRQYSWVEMFQPLSVLVAFGVAGLLVGAVIMARRTEL